MYLRISDLVMNRLVTSEIASKMHIKPLLNSKFSKCFSTRPIKIKIKIKID